MKRVLFIALVAINIIGCKKDDNVNGSTQNITVDCKKNPYRKGSKITRLYPSSTTPVTQTIDSDTTINGISYVKINTILPQINGTSITWINANVFMGVDSNQQVYQLIPSLGANSLPETNMIYFKMNKPVGTSWDFTYSSQISSTIQWKYVHTILSNTESFTLKGVKYNNGQKVKNELFSIINGGTPISYGQVVTNTYFCGIGPVTGDNNGSLVFTLTDFTY